MASNGPPPRKENAINRPTSTPAPALRRDADRQGKITSKPIGRSDWIPALAAGLLWMSLETNNQSESEG